MNEITKELLEALKLAGSIIGHPDDSASKHIAYVIAKAEAALAEPQADADGWIPWSGGKCPIEPPAHNLFIRFRSGIENGDHVSRAQSYFWLHEERAHPADIIAYRIVKESNE